MKKYIFLLLVFISTATFAQKQLSEFSAQELELKKKESLATNNLSDAAIYKKAFDLRTQIDAAVIGEDYVQAAALKKQLTSLSIGGSSNPNNEIERKLEEDIKKAVAAEDYEKASKLKKELNTIQSNNSNNSNTLTNESLTLPYIEFVNQVYFWNKKNNSIISLEYDSPEMRTQAAGGFGYAQATSYWVIQGITSDVKLNPNESISFILKVTPGVNPTDMFRLVKFQILGKRSPSRHMASFTSASAAYAGSSTKERRDNDVPITYNKISDGYYEVIINGTLIPGEYTFYGLGKMYSFSVNSTYTNYSSSVSDNNSHDNSKIQSYATTNFSKNDIYKNNNVTWYGLDFSLFNMTFEKKMSKEGEMIKYIETYQQFYEKEVAPVNLGRWLRKTNFTPDKNNTEGLYKINLKQNWISPNYHDLSQNEIQNHLIKYNTNGDGIGLVLIPEQFNEDRGAFIIQFVWFDKSTKAIIHTQKISGKGRGGIMQSGWRDALLDGTKEYIDKYYKIEKGF